MKNLIVSLSLLFSISLMANESLPIYFGKNSGGTAFRIKYKDKKYIITAGHVCRSEAIGSINDVPIEVIASRLDVIDVCILKDNKRVKNLKTYNIKVEFDSEEILVRHGWHWGGQKVPLRSMSQGKVSDFIPFSVYPIQAKCEKDVLCAAIRSNSYGVSTSILTTYGNSGGPVLNKKNEIVGIIIMINHRSLGIFTPIIEVVDILEGKSPKETLSDGNKPEEMAKTFCEGLGIFTKPLVAKMGFYNFNIFCRKEVK